MRKSFAWLGLLAFAASAYADPAITHVSFKSGKAYYHAVVSDLTSDRVTVQAVLSPKLRSIHDLTAEDQPEAAITGTFFNPRDGYPVGDVLVDGKLMAEGKRGSVLAIDWAGKCHIFDSDFQQQVDWLDYRYALRGTVRLIRDGKVAPDPKSQKFRDPRIWGRARRTAAGITSSGKLVMIATKNSVTLSDLGRAMRTLDVVNAVNLDGGGSTCLYYRGKVLISPQRRLSNLLVVQESTPLEGYPGWMKVSGWVRKR